MNTQVVIGMLVISVLVLGTMLELNLIRFFSYFVEMMGTKDYILFPCGWKNLRKWAHREGKRRWRYKEPFVPMLEAVKAAKQITSIEDAEKWLVRNFAPKG